MHAPSRDQAHNLVMCPDWELNLPPSGVQDDAPTIWATWPGQGISEFRKCPCCLFSLLQPPHLQLPGYSSSFEGSLFFVFTEFKEQGVIKKYALRSLIASFLLILLSLGHRWSLLLDSYLFLRTLLQKTTHKDIHSYTLLFLIQKRAY